MPLERGQMKLEDGRRIRKNIVHLKSVEPNILLDYFMQEELFDFSDIESIISSTSVADRWWSFERLLFSCGPRAYDTLLMALEAKHYTDLVRQIRTTKLAKQCVDAENRDSNHEIQQSEMAQIEIKMKELKDEHDKVKLQKYASTSEKSYSSYMGNVPTPSPNVGTSLLPYVFLLNQALVKGKDEPVAIKVMVLDVTHRIREPMFMLIATVADQSQACTLFLYDQKYEERMFNPDHSLLITNAINKQTHLVVTSITAISLVPKFKIPQTVIDKQKYQMGNAAINSTSEGNFVSLGGTVSKIRNQSLVITNAINKETHLVTNEFTSFDIFKKDHQTVKEAMSSPEGELVSTKAKVSKICVSPHKTAYNNGLVWFTVVTLKDATASVNMSLWGPEAEKIKKAQILALENVKVIKHSNNKKRLTNTPVSIIKIISDEQLSQLSSEDDEEENLKTGTIIGLVEAEPYSSCPLRQCRNTKLTTTEDDGMLMCPKHGQCIALENANVYMSAMFHVLTSNKTICTRTAFMPVIEVLFDAKGQKFKFTFNKQALERDIRSMLPFSLRFIERNGTIQRVCPKRKIPITCRISSST